MKRFSKLFTAAATLLAASTLVFGQDQSQPAGSQPQMQQQTEPGGGWPRVDASPNPYQTADAQSPEDAQPPPPQENNNQPYPSRPPYSQMTPPRRLQPVPPQLTIGKGAYITVRVNQLLSSDKNEQGDAFAATLAQPVVVNGVVVAEPGQTLGGQVVESVKAGRVEGVARLGIKLTDLTLVDGQQVPIQSQLIARKGDTSLGRDAGAIVGTTALGAAIGGSADWGRGAAIGAGAGLVVSTIGVLVTRGHPSVIYPEQLLTFRIEAPVTISTAAAPQAFRYVQQDEYNNNPYYQGSPETRPLYASAPPPPPPPYYGYGYPYYYGYPAFYYGYGYPGYYWGPSIGFYYRGGFYRGGYYGRHR